MLVRDPLNIIRTYCLFLFFIDTIRSNKIIALIEFKNFIVDSLIQFNNFMVNSLIQFKDFMVNFLDFEIKTLIIILRGYSIFLLVKIPINEYLYSAVSYKPVVWFIVLFCSFIINKSVNKIFDIDRLLAFFDLPTNTTITELVRRLLMIIYFGDEFYQDYGHENNLIHSYQYANIYNEDLYDTLIHKRESKDKFFSPIIFIISTIVVIEGKKKISLLAIPSYAEV